MMMTFSLSILLFIFSFFLSIGDLEEEQKNLKTRFLSLTRRLEKFILSELSISIDGRCRISHIHEIGRCAPTFSLLLRLPSTNPSAIKRKKFPFLLLYQSIFNLFFYYYYYYFLVCLVAACEKEKFPSPQNLSEEKNRNAETKKNYFFFSCLRVRVCVCVSSVCEETYTNNMCDFFLKIWKPLKMLLCAAPPSR